MGEVAAPVQAVQAPAPQTAVQNAFHLQRKCACGSYGTGGGECDKCRKDGAKLQRAAAKSQTDLAELLDTADTPDGLPAIVHDVLHSSGHPLDPTTRAWLEPRFGHDFSNVRVHTDARAAESAHAVNALAYTVGHDVVFGAGQYAPNTDRGHRLLAHELTHVVQQSRGGAAQQGKAISEPSDAAEVEADATANRVMNSVAPVQVTQAPNATLHALTDAETAGAIAGSIVGTALLSVGIAWLAGAFDKSRFSDTELTAYLTFLATNRRIEDHRDSDNKARDIVRRWRENDAAFNIDSGFSTTAGTLSAVDLKRLLIQEMLSGVTAGADENAILTILENSSTAQVVELLDPAHGVSVQDIDNKVGGENHDRFEQILESRLPRTGPNAATQRRQTGSTCTARQALMVDYARQKAVAVVNDALTALSRAGESDVAGAINCWFPAATPAQINDIRSVLEQVRNTLPSRVYHCGGEGGQAELEGMVFTGPQGQQVPVECVSEYAASFVARSSTGQQRTFNDVFLCAQFFRQSPEGQVITVIHETVHGTGITTDPQYNPSCGLSIATALTNPDSYAYLAMNLAQLQTRRASRSGQTGQSGQQSNQSGQVQRKASDNGAVAEVPEEVDEVLRSPGQSIDPATRAFMEKRFDRSFGDVRLHTDSAAAQSARAVKAHAYTVGDDVVFGAGQYQPGTGRGAALLAHELTHVAQQQTHGVASQQTAKPVSEPSDAAEVEAENVAAGVLSGAPVQVKQAPSAAVHAGMKPEEVGGLVGGLVGGAVLIGGGFAIAAALGAFESAKFSDCKDKEPGKITDAAKVARKWLDDGLKAVEKVIASPKDAEEWIVALLRQHFKIAPTDKGPLGELREGLSTLQSNFDRALFQCGGGDCGKEDDKSYVPGSTSSLIGPYLPFGRIHICKAVLADGKEDELAETILHEMGHRYGGKNPSVEIYRKLNANTYFALPTEMALQNADSYAQFCKDVSNIGARHAEEAKQQKEAEEAEKKEAEKKEQEKKEQEKKPAGKKPAGKSGGKVKRKAIGAGEPAAVPPSVHEVLHSPGEPLDVATREWIEPRLGRDFSDVRLHRDQSAAQSARAINAAAYTVGDDIVFGAGEYAPHTQRGTHLLAHELTHVAQHANGSQNERPISHPSDAAEVEAESVAAGVMSGEAVQVNQARSATVHALEGWQTGLIVGGVVAGVAALVAWALGVFDRAKFDDCPDEWQQKALAAEKVARQWVNDAVAAVDAVIAKPDSTDPLIAELLDKHFHIAPSDKSGLAKLREGLVDIQSNFDNAKYKCEDKCGGSDDEYTAGYTNALLGPYLPYGRIHLCPTVFEDKRADELAETIAHEMFHRFASKNKVHIYRKTQSGTYWRLTKEEALENADSFAQFAKDVSTKGATKAKDAKDKKEAEKSGGEVKRKAIGPGEPASVPRSVHEVLHSPGEPLADETRDWMEPRFEHDFGDVKVHADARAAESAREVNAAAYTVGRDVVFGAGRYEPETTSGRELLAHELTHVVQQREQAGPSSTSLEIGRDAAPEHEADRMGHQVAHGDPLLGPVQNSRAVVSRQVLQRQPAPEPQPAPETQPAPQTAPAPESQPAPESKPTPEAAPERKPEEEQPGGVPVVDETSGMRGYPPRGQCVDFLWAREYERILRLDTISVVALSARAASDKKEDVRAAREKNQELQQGIIDSCVEFIRETHPFRVRFYYLDTDLRTTERAPVNTEDAKKNRALGDKLGASQSPRVSIYVERDSESTEDFSDAKTLTAKIKKIIEASSQSSARRGAKKGLLPGYILGGLTSIGVGIGVGAAVAGGGASTGAAIGWGILAGAVAGGAVIGLSAALGALFGYLGGTDRGTKELTKERIKQVTAFVGVLRKAGEVKGKELTSSDADDLARDAVTLWIDRPGTLPLTVKDRRLLIKVMLDGPTLDDDERSIIKLLENSTDAEVLQVLDPTAGEKERVTIQMLDEDIHGEEWKEFRQMLQARFPTLGAPKIQRTETTTEPACEADQAIMVTQALTRATEVVPIAQQRISEYLADPKKQQEVLSKIQCYFPGAVQADVEKIKGMFDSIQQLIPSSRYVCLGKKTAISKTPRGPRPVACESDSRAADVAQTVPYYEPDMQTIKSAMPETYLCPTFFASGPIYQATSLIHEWVHRVIPASETDTVDPKCGNTKLATALENPDSYALLARDLAEGRTAAAGQPSVTIGNFRNSGSPTAENRCVSCTQIPTLGIDPTTGANFMEVRGDITGHRPDALYDFKRTKEVAIWAQLNDGSWKPGLPYEPAGTLDDASADDEDTVPKFNQIYSIDGPGPHVPLPSVGDDTIKAGVYKGSFVETVNVKVGDGPWTPSSNEFKWHSLTWFERGDDNLLRRTPKNNEIAPGAITVGNNPPQP